MDSKKIKIEDINGIGSKYQLLFNKARIYNAYDLLNTYPKRYVYYDPVSPHLVTNGDTVTIEGRIVTPVSVQTYRKNLSSLNFSIDSNGEIVKVIIFNRLFLRKMLHPNCYLRVYGKYNYFKREIVAADIFFDDKKTTDIIYGIKDIPDSVITKSIKNVLAMGATLEERLPSYLLGDVISINEAIINIHLPENKKENDKAKYRVKYEEILEFYLKLKYLSYEKEKAYREPIKYDLNRVKTLINNIDFELSDDQKKVTNEIFKDFLKPCAMNRLLQGDVGSGKTIVSLISAYAMVTAGFQVVIMAPTEILAEQHLEYFKKYLNPLGVNCELLTGSVSKIYRKEVLRCVEKGYTNILIGTHALFYEDINYRNLGYAIIDEQHRFGVEARNKLFKGKNIDALYLTATPIPRSLSLTLFSDLDSSTIRGNRENKGNIKTEIIDKKDLSSLYLLVENELSKGHQAYFVCHEIDDNDNGYSVESLEKELESIYPDYRIGILHGRLKDSKKTEIMNMFKDGMIDILISTTVIEVGISVDNATIMAVMDADYFGLATLHQLRGRVARGLLDGACYLVTENTDKERLLALQNISDGFELSEIDLKLRGPGDFFGMRQSGIPEFVFADFSNDYKLFKKINDLASLVFEKALENEIESKTYLEYVLSKIESNTNLN